MVTQWASWLREPLSLVVWPYIMAGACCGQQHNNTVIRIKDAQGGTLNAQMLTRAHFTIIYTLFARALIYSARDVNEM